ncbi:MAG: uracil-DNA glycosylase family protein [Nitrospiraceae bacterium]
MFLDFRLAVSACEKCPYGKVREKPITGDGDCRAPIVLVGPSPRKRDDVENTVFSGRAGQRLEQMLKEAELNINTIFRTYAIRCYGGREPSFGEFASYKRCQPHTTDLIKLMKPHAIVICGYKVFKWMLLRWTSEIVDETSFYRWVGQTVRLKEVWGDRKFFIIANPADLARARNPEAEAKSVDALRLMKSYVKSIQHGEPIALEMTDLKRRPHTRTEQQTFGWS